MRVSVIGCGHLGIPHAAAMAEIGHEVIGVDLDQARIDRLNAGESPIYEEGLPELLAAHTASGRLRFTTSLAEAAEFADVHFLAVGTPIDADGRSYDTGQVFGAARALAPHLTRPTVIIGKSTVTVGTTRDLAALLARLSPAGEEVEVVWNRVPARGPRHRRHPAARPDRRRRPLAPRERTPYARSTRRSWRTASRCSSPTRHRRTHQGRRQRLPRHEDLLHQRRRRHVRRGRSRRPAAHRGHRSRPAHRPRRPERRTRLRRRLPPKDVRAFTASARTLGATEAATLLRAAEEVNESRPTAALKLIEQTLGRPVDGVRVTVWGASFKAGTDDVRESPPWRWPP